MRWLAADVAEESGEEALPAWREALSEPLLTVHARCALIVWDDTPELTGAEQLWLAVEAAAAGPEERGPDEALCCLWERVPGTSVDDRLAAIRSSGHPAAAGVAFQGESPAEHLDAYSGGRAGGRKRKPYSLGPVNATLAKFGGRC